MLNNGFVKLHRSITTWEWYKNPNTTHLFLHLIVTANIKKSRFQGLDVPAGARITSVKALVEETGLTTKQVRTALEHLEKTGEITRKTANKYSLITVENYSKYQASEEQAANKGQTKGKQRANKGQQNKKDKNIREEEVYIYPLLSPTEPVHFTHLLGEGETDHLLSVLSLEEFDALMDALSPAKPADIKKPFQYALTAAKKRGFIQ